MVLTSLEIKIENNIDKRKGKLYPIIVGQFLVSNTNPEARWFARSLLEINFVETYNFGRQ